MWADKFSHQTATLGQNNDKERSQMRSLGYTSRRAPDRNRRRQKTDLPWITFNWFTFSHNVKWTRFEKCWWRPRYFPCRTFPLVSHLLCRTHFSLKVREFGTALCVCPHEQLPRTKNWYSWCICDRLCCQRQQLATLRVYKCRLVAGPGPDRVKRQQTAILILSIFDGGWESHFLIGRALKICGPVSAV